MKQIERLSPILRLVLKWATLRNWVFISEALAHSYQTPVLGVCLISMLPGWSQDQVLQLILTLCKGPKCIPSQKSPGSEQTWPKASHLVWVTNTSWKACLQSPQQGQKTSLNPSWWLSDVKQMCWKWRKLCHSFFLSLMWPWWLKSPDRGDVLMWTETRIVVTILPCLCFLQLYKAQSRATAPEMPHNALYRYILVTLTGFWTSPH